jgi:hypothetical protein
MKVTKITPPGWATAMAEAAALVSAMTTRQQTTSRKPIDQTIRKK